METYVPNLVDLVLEHSSRLASWTKDWAHQIGLRLVIDDQDEGRANVQELRGHGPLRFARTIGRWLGVKSRLDYPSKSYWKRACQPWASSTTFDRQSCSSIVIGELPEAYNSKRTHRGLCPNDPHSWGLTIFGTRRRYAKHLAKVGRWICLASSPNPW